MSDADLILRVAYIDTNKSLDDVRDMFSSCGNIQATYPFRTGDKKGSTFVEFDDKTAVMRAQAAQTSAAKVHALAFSPQLMAHFSVVAANQMTPSRKTKLGLLDVGPSKSQPVRVTPQKPRAYSSSSERRSSGRSVQRHAPSDYHPKKYSRPSRDPPTWTVPPREYTRYSSRSVSKPEKENRLRTDDYASMVPLMSSQPTPELQCVPPCPSPATSISSSRVHTPPPHAIHGLPPKPTGAFPLTVDISMAPAPPYSTPAPSVSPSIILACDGEQYTCELDTLPDDPQGVISVLTQTAAHPLERDKWMIVAGHYRGKGNTVAALAVVFAMLSVLTSPLVGMGENELRPALLMLSSCHTELGKQTRILHGDEAEITREHFRMSQLYLQKIYGTSHCPHADADVRVFRGYLSNTSNTAGELSGSTAAATASTTSELQAQIVDLQREVQLLQDRNSSNLAYISQSRAAKRKFEKELDAEKRARRKAQGELETARYDLAGLRRGERHALDQCRREVEARRRAEERMGRCKERTSEVEMRMSKVMEEAAMKERKARECFGRLGILFLKAAKGEVDSAAVGSVEADFGTTQKAKGPTVAAEADVFS